LHAAVLAQIAHCSPNFAARKGAPVDRARLPAPRRLGKAPGVENRLIEQAPACIRVKKLRL